MSEYREALEMICQLCARLNPQHTGNPDTCDCKDVAFLRKAIAAQQSVNADVMPCGHPLAEAYQGEDGGTYCRICESA